MTEFEKSLKLELQKRNRANRSPKSCRSIKTSSSMSEFEKALLSELNSRMDAYAEFNTALRNELQRRRAIQHEKELRLYKQGWRVDYSDICSELRSLFNGGDYTPDNINIVLDKFGISGYHVTLSFSEESGVLFYIDEPSTISRQRRRLSAQKRTFQYNGIWFNSTDDLKEYKRCAILKIA